MLILPEQVEEVSAGGIVLPEITQEREAMAQMYGTVIALGSHCFSGEPEPWCKVGDKVVFAIYAGQIFKGNDGKRYRLIRDKEIVAVVNK